MQAWARLGWFSGYGAQSWLARRTSQAPCRVRNQSMPKPARTRPIEAISTRGHCRREYPTQARYSRSASRTGSKDRSRVGVPTLTLPVALIGPPLVALSGRLLLKGAGVGGNVDGVAPEHVQRDDLQSALVGAGQHHGSRGAVAVRAQPVRRGHAPPVPRYQAGEAALGHRRGQVIADAALMREELRGHHRADRVAAQVLRSGGAAPVPVEPGERIGPTRLQFPAEHISVAHICSIGTAAVRPQDQRPSPAQLRNTREISRNAGWPSQDVASGGFLWLLAGAGGCRRLDRARAGGLVLTVWSVKMVITGVSRLRSTGPGWRKRCGGSVRAGCCRGPRTWTRRCSSGNSGTSSAAAGCAWRAASNCRSRATSGPRRPGRAAYCWSGARTGRCGRSRTPAATAGTSCCPAARARSRR